MNYRQLLSEKDFLKVKRRAAQLKSGVDLVSIDYAGFELRFRVKSAVDQKYYNIILQLDDMTPDKVIAAGSRIDTVLRDAKLRCYCSCPAYHFWYSYKAWTRGYGIFPETRYPKIRNPRLEGFLCKHLYLVLQIYPFWSKQIGKKLRVHWSEEQVQQVEDSLASALRGVKLRD